MLVRRMLADGHGFEGPNEIFIMLPCIPLYMCSNFHGFARTGPLQGSLAAAAAAAVHRLRRGALGAAPWRLVARGGCARPP